MPVKKDESEKDNIDALENIESKVDNNVDSISGKADFIKEKLLNLM